MANLTLVDSSPPGVGPGGPAAWAKAAASPGGEEFARGLLSLYEQLLATRIELVDHAGPSEDHVTLSRSELDCVVAQIDTAIVSARQMVSSTVKTPEADAKTVPASGSEPITPLENT